MLKKMINSAQIDFEIDPIDPLLIKSGQATVGGVDMSFVRTYRFGDADEPFIPGSSLKGMLRAYAEKICRSLRDKPVPVCLPYIDPAKKGQNEGAHQASCGLSFEKYKRDKTITTLPSTEIYRNSCPACRLFGSHVYAGRLGVSDAYLTPEFKETGKPLLETRDGVAIDRITGGAAPGAKYDIEVLTRGLFGATLEIRNFERWQLGLIGLVLRDMREGRVRIGFGKSRGLGRFKARITAFELTYFQKNVTQLAGVHALCPSEENQAYGFFPETSQNPSSMPPPLARKGISLRQVYDITDDWINLLAPAVDDLQEYIQTTAWPGCLEDFVKWRK